MKSIRLAVVILAAATLPVSSMLADELDDAAKQMAAANNAFAIDLLQTPRQGRSISVRGTIFELIIDLDLSVTVRVLEGGIVFTTLARQETALIRPGKVLVIRPNNQGQTITNSLNERQLALLQPIVDLGSGNVTPGQDRRDQLRDQLRGKSGGGAPPPQDWSTCA